jgi:hypothetical protein
MITNDSLRKDILLVPGLILQRDADGYWMIFVMPSGQRSKVLIGEYGEKKPSVEWAKDFFEND